LSRLDHRHNFSIYNTLLHLSSQQPSDARFRIESLAFLPQILLSLVVMPLLLAKKDLASTMLAQTFAFVTFNKVCTSQVSLAVVDRVFNYTDARIVLPLVHGLPAILLSRLIAPATACCGNRRSYVVGRGTGVVVATRIQP
jgi:hypothetical protein